MSVVDIASTLTLIGAVITLILAYRKAPHENRSLDAGAAKVYQETAQLAAEHANRLEARIVILEQRTASQEERILALEAENADLKDWARRLVNQVISLGGSPVKLKTDIPTRPRKPKE